MKEEDILKLSKQELLKQMSLAKETGNYEGQIPTQEFLDILNNIPDDVFEFEQTWYVKPNQELEKKFTEICNFLADPKIRNRNLPETSQTIKDLYSENYENWKIFIEQIHSIRDMIYSADYHIMQIDDLYKSLEQSLRKTKPTYNQNMVHGNIYTRKLDYEFQAFVLKIRSPLDYLNNLVCMCYLGLDSNYFTDLVGSLPCTIAPIYKKYESDLNDDIIMSYNKNTVRNILSHQRYITLGTINTFHDKNIGESFLVLNTSGERIELKNIQKFLIKKRDVVANFLIESIWVIIK